MADTSTTERVQLKSDDATPIDVYLKLVDLNKNNYPGKDCLPCGTTIRMGFFFDAFGRNRDEDDKSTPQYSNICRLWEAHRDNSDKRKPSIKNQFWFRFYYSGLGTPTNWDMDVDAWCNAESKIMDDLTKKAKKAISPAEEAKNTAKAVAAITDVDKEKLFLNKPVEKSYSDIIKDALHQSAKIITSPRRLLNRTKGYGVLMARRIMRHPFKLGFLATKDALINAAYESIPIIRDNPEAAEYMGLGVDTRLAAAARQFEATYELVKAQTLSVSKINKIEVSVFGANHGGVLARVFINNLVEKYKDKYGDFNIKGVEIEIKFLGLFDVVSSVMSEMDAQMLNLTVMAVAALAKKKELAEYIPSFKANEKDRPLAVPGEVKNCVHFAAAHELRTYQRLDSLEKTRGDQFLFPGTSCDVVGGAPKGTLGANAELMRIPLREMLEEALLAGSMLDTMEDLFVNKPGLFNLFTLADPITYNGKQYKIRDLMKAYLAQVEPTSPDDPALYDAQGKRKLGIRGRRVPGLKLIDHSTAFVQWLAVRYQDPDFKYSVMGSEDDWLKEVNDTDNARKMAKLNDHQLKLVG